MTRPTPEAATVTPVFSYLMLSGWHGSSSTLVETIGMTPKRFRIRAITRTKLAGRNRWLEPGQTALVPLSAVLHGQHSKPSRDEHGQLRRTLESEATIDARDALALGQIRRTP